MNPADLKQLVSSEMKQVHWPKGWTLRGPAPDPEDRNAVLVFLTHGKQKLALKSLRFSLSLVMKYKDPSFYIRKHLERLASNAEKT